MAGFGFIVGRLTVPASNSGAQSSAPQIITVPVLITATANPSVQPMVTIITATPQPGSIGALPTGVIDDVDAQATLPAAPTIDPDLLDADSVLQATVTALPDGCILHVLAEGEFPGLVAETYDVSVVDLMEINGLDEETARFLDIGDVLIVPLETCPLTPEQVASVTNVEANSVEDSPDVEATAETTAEVTDEPTVAPTSTLPPTAVNAQVEIGRVIRAGDITAEGLEIRNTGGVVNLTGWTLEDSAGNVYTFPTLQLFTNGLVTVYTRRGTNTPIVLYWGRSTAVWGEAGDTVTLRDDDGAVQATMRVNTEIDLTGN
jgi:hypothetical protein